MIWFDTVFIDFTYSSYVWFDLLNNFIAFHLFLTEIYQVVLPKMSNQFKSKNESLIYQFLFGKKRRKLLRNSIRENVKFLRIQIDENDEFREMHFIMNAHEVEWRERENWRRGVFSVSEKRKLYLEKSTIHRGNEWERERDRYRGKESEAERERVIIR